MNPDLPERWLQLFDGPSDGLRLPWEPGMQTLYIEDPIRKVNRTEWEVAVYLVVPCRCGMCNPIRAEFTHYELRSSKLPT